jgi:hypothetical protein
MDSQVKIVAITHFHGSHLISYHRFVCQTVNCMQSTTEKPQKFWRTKRLGKTLEDRTNWCSATMSRSDSDWHCQNKQFCCQIHPITSSHDWHSENCSIAIISPTGTNSRRWRIERKTSGSQPGRGWVRNRCHRVSKGTAARGKSRWSKKGEWKRKHGHPCFTIYFCFFLGYMHLVAAISKLLSWTHHRQQQN